MKEGYFQDQVVNWLPAPNSRGLILVGHGLNVHPFKFRPLIDFFHGVRFDVLLFTLAGHREGTSIDQVTEKQWMEDAGEALKLAENVSQKKGYPYYFCGFSTSCLTIQRQLQTGQWNLQKQILLAPAIALKPIIRATLSFSKVPLSLKTKSLTPIEYRYNDHLNLQTYRALLKCYKDFHKGEQAPIDIPTLVYHRPSDELISEQGLRKIVERKEHWIYDSIAPQKNGFWQHLIIDEPSMGGQDWAKFQQNVKNFLI